MFLHRKIVTDIYNWKEFEGGWGVSCAWFRVLNT